MVAEAPIIHVDTKTYDKQLAAKVERVKTQFRDYYSDEIAVFESKKKHYRMRAEFRIWHDYEKDEVYYVMFQGGGHGAEKFRVDDFHVGSDLMNALMQVVIEGDTPLSPIIAHHAITSANCRGRNAPVVMCARRAWHRWANETTRACSRLPRRSPRATRSQPSTSR